MKRGRIETEITTIFVAGMILLLVALFNLMPWFVGLVLNQWIPTAWGLHPDHILTYWQCFWIGVVFIPKGSGRG